MRCRPGPPWEVTVLGECYESVDDISLHMSFLSYEQDHLDYLAKPVLLDPYIETAGGVIDCIRAKKRSRHRVHISFDEWTVRNYSRAAARYTLTSG
jgi:alpha-N-arabinofuranosidase